MIELVFDFQFKLLKLKIILIFIYLAVLYSYEKNIVTDYGVYNANPKII